ncbi:hypothetical protein F5Y06DRAFT_30218 [Hypoxylon sp. FL0890]|nr:hypothetical protein F5Y06DRAFT_30218 [Hypoxylon sp. FL0890]
MSGRRCRGELRACYQHRNARRGRFRVPVIPINIIGVKLLFPVYGLRPLVSSLAAFLFLLFVFSSESCFAHLSLPPLQMQRKIAAMLSEAKYGGRADRHVFCITQVGPAKITN